MAPAILFAIFVFLGHFVATVGLFFYRAQTLGNIMIVGGAIFMCYFLWRLMLLGL